MANNLVKENDLKYEQLSVINNELFSQIKKIFIFAKSNAFDVIFITNNEEIYGFGFNKYGRLGLGHNSSVPEPTLIPELGAKHVINIEFGSYVMVALTETHEVYTCGHDDLGCLGNGDNSKIYRKPNKIDLSHKIVDIKCCSLRTFLITDKNQVYWFGHYRFDENIQVNIPTIVDFKEKKVVNISCGSSHTLALTNYGEVYSIGGNHFGQLGLGHNNHINSPQIIQIYQIKKISTGYDHSLLLTTRGEIYSFGQNNENQLGKVDNTDSNIPERILENCKFLDIFAFENISMALNEFNLIKFWGMKTSLTLNISRFQDVVNIFSPNSFPFKPFSPEDVFHNNKPISRMTKTMAKAFNNSEDSDIKFKLKRKESEEFDYIYCHKWFIKNNSEYFEKMFSKDWSESQINEKQINDFSYEAFYYFIKCLYTETIETENIEIIIELLSITDQYLDEEMKTKCVQKLKPLINVQNVCSLYSVSLTFRSKELEEFCFKFMVKNMYLIIETEEYEKMNIITTKRFLSNYFKQNNCRNN